MSRAFLRLKYLLKYDCICGKKVVCAAFCGRGSCMLPDDVTQRHTNWHCG